MWQPSNSMRNYQLDGHNAKKCNGAFIEFTQWSQFFVVRLLILCSNFSPVNFDLFDYLWAFCGAFLSLIRVPPTFLYFYFVPPPSILFRSNIDYAKSKNAIFSALKKHSSSSNHWQVQSNSLQCATPMTTTTLKQYRIFHLINWCARRFR